MKQYNLNNSFIEPTRTVKKFYQKAMTYKTSLRRNLSNQKLERITELINQIPIDLVCFGKSIDEMWTLFKTSLTKIIDRISPLKKFRINQAKRSYPCLCAELKALSKSKEKLLLKSKLLTVWTTRVAASW